MNRIFFERLNNDEKYVFAQAILNPIMRLGLEGEIRKLSSEIVSLALPTQWSYEALVTFAQRFQRRQHLKQSYQDQLDVIEAAQAFIENLKQMET